MSAELLRQTSERVETLLRHFDAFPAATGAREDAHDLVHQVSQLHGEALKRLIRSLGETLGDDRAREVVLHACDDPVVTSALVTHGVHPLPLEERVRKAIDSVRPYLHSHGGDVEVLEVSEDAVLLRLQGHCDGCTASQATLKSAIERAVFEAAPEVLAVHAEESEAEPHAPPVVSAELLPSVVS